MHEEQVYGRKKAIETLTFVLKLLNKLPGLFDVDRFDSVELLHSLLRCAK